MPTLKLKITILSPIHVGNGETLREGLDFIEEDGMIHVLSIDRLIDKFRNRPEALDRMASPGFSIKGFLGDFGVSATEVSRYSMRGGQPQVKEVRQAIKAGMSYPIIPGSSIKGAVRTAVLWSLTHDADKNFALRPKAVQVLQKTLAAAGQERRPRDRFAARNLERKFIEKEFIDPADKRGRRKILGPNNSLMRIIQAPDAQFEVRDLTLCTVKVSSENHNGRHMWKTFGRERQNVTDHMDATPLYVEALRPGSQSPISVKIDEFLLDRAAEANGRYRPGKEEASLLSGIEPLFEAINDRSFELMGGEYDYLEELGSSEFYPAMDFYAEQMERIKDGPSDLCVFPLGWGTGWKGMTGPVVPDDMIEEFRRVFRRMSGKRNWKSFPKTRKFSFEGGQPGLPPGWVELKVEE